jgi:glycosyltransferase involved in cell wall biosynthesis
MKVAVVHDYFTQSGGAEKVAAELFHLLPGAALHTLVAARNCLPDSLGDIDIKTSWIQRMPGITSHYRLYFMLYPLAVGSLQLSSYDLILSSSSSYAKGIHTRRDSMHVCYCHTPTRWVWDLKRYSDREKLSDPVRAALLKLVTLLRIWDVSAARQPDHFIANSRTVAERIRSVYQRHAEIIYPPIDIDRFQVRGKEEDYYLVLSRLVSYKRLDLAVEACTLLKKKLLIVGDGPHREALAAKAGPTVTFCGRLSDTQVDHLVSHCRALIFPGEEDFGMAPLEVAAAGRPCIAYRAGGATETIIDGMTGQFFDAQDVDHLMEAIQQFELHSWSPDDLRRHAEKFSLAVFRQNMCSFLIRAGVPAKVFTTSSNHNNTDIFSRHELLEQNYGWN